MSSYQAAHVQQQQQQQPLYKRTLVRGHTAREPREWERFCMRLMKNWTKKEKKNDKWKQKPTREYSFGRAKWVRATLTRRKQKEEEEAEEKRHYAHTVRTNETDTNGRRKTEGECEQRNAKKGAWLNYFASWISFYTLIVLIVRPFGFVVLVCACVRLCFCVWVSKWATEKSAKALSRTCIVFV